MKLYNTTQGVLIENGQFFIHPLPWDQAVNRKGLFHLLNSELKNLQSISHSQSVQILANNSLPPLGSQEVWAAGVTYIRSKVARMDESKSSGASKFYDLVYDADRPELFFKAGAGRVTGHEGKVRIRRDSTWNVPEPELTLFISSHGTIEGYSIGNDMSSRSIEGENPLYLPQAKVYDGCASIGPCLFVPENPISSETGINLIIERGGEEVFEGSASLNQMKRSLPELAMWLTKECSFPSGVMLMTGTCIVPPDGFTLQVGDLIYISIDNIGILKNIVS